MLQLIYFCIPQILPGIQNEDPSVRNMAVRSLGLCCLTDKETAKSHLLLLTQVQAFYIAIL